VRRSVENRDADGSPVVVGCGVVAANGIGRKAFAGALAEGVSGIGDLVSFDASAWGRERAAEVPEFDVEPFLRSPKNYLDRSSALAFAACEMAVRKSGLAFDARDPRRGISLGSMGGNLHTLEVFAAAVAEKGPRLAPPFLFPHTYSNATIGLLSIEYGLAGPHEQFCSGGAASLMAIGKAARLLAEGRADAMIAGGAESFSEPLFRVAVERGWLSPQDSGGECCRPFASGRNGAVLGEGAAMFVLARTHPSPLARLLGSGAGRTPENAIRNALADARLETEAIDGVFAAAGGYPAEDAAEAAAIIDVFGKGVSVVAPKKFFGECLGASGALNLAAALCAIRSGALPPTREEDREFLGETFGKRAAARPPRTLLVNAGSPDTGAWASAVLAGC